MSDTSGPAFPSANKLQLGEYSTTGHAGLTKRELFAAMAMQGMVANERLATQFTDELLAADAVEAADALLIELAKGGG